MANSSLPMSLPHVSAIQATLQGPTPSIRYEAASENNDKRYEDRAGFEGFEVRLPVWERRSEARRVGCRSGVPAGADCHGGASHHRSVCYPPSTDEALRRD